MRKKESVGKIHKNSSWEIAENANYEVREIRDERD